MIFYLLQIIPNLVKIQECLNEGSNSGNFCLLKPFVYQGSQFTPIINDNICIPVQSTLNLVVYFEGKTLRRKSSDLA